MCPLAPLSQPANIGLDWTDEEVVMCLKGIVSGAPLPPNVITEVNPYNVLPWDLPEDIWYFFKSEGHKATDGGYWKASKEDHIIFINSTTTGSRTTLEYYLSLVPTGIKTDWVMHEYRINQKRICEVNKSLDSSSLSRIFLSYGQNSNGEQCSNAGTQDANGKMNNVDSEKENHSQDSTSRSKLFSREEGPLVISEGCVRQARPDHRTQGLHETYDFSKGDFLELLDLDNPESPSSSSENSSILTVSSDECFDPFALLQELEAEHDQGMQPPKHTDSKCQVSAPLIPKKVVHRAGPLGICQGNSLNSLQSRAILMPDSSVPNLAVDQQFLKSNNSKNVHCLLSGGVSQDPPRDGLASSSKGIQVGRTAVKSKSVADRITKLKKKYLCFMPF